MAYALFPTLLFRLYFVQQYLPSLGQSCFDALMFDLLRPACVLKILNSLRPGLCFCSIRGQKLLQMS